MNTLSISVSTYDKRNKFYLRLITFSFIISDNFCQVNNIDLVKYFSSMSDQSNIVSFEELRNLQKENKTLIIDVREPSELLETGILPNSINIPCKFCTINIFYLFIYFNYTVIIQ